MKTAVLRAVFLSRDVPFNKSFSQHLAYTAGATGVLERRGWAQKTRRDAGNTPVVSLLYRLVNPLSYSREHVGV